MNTLFHLGVDVSKTKLDCALRLSNGKYRNKIVTNAPQGFTDLSLWLEKQGSAISDTHVCMEATGIYWEAVAEFLSNAGFRVSVINPAQIKAFGKSRLVRTKTDKADAQLIACFCCERAPEPWRAPSLSEQSLRAMVMRLDSLQTMHTQESNRLLVSRELLKADIQAHIDWLDEQIKQLARRIREHIHQDPDLHDKQKLLESIPGVGERTIALLLAFSISPQRFDNARQAAAFAGLDPRLHESGTSVHDKPRLSKIGHAFLRKALYMPAMTALYRTDWGKRFFLRLSRAGKAAKLIIGAMMRKLIHVAFGVLKSAKPFDPSLHDA
ncbi:IS110 family transposase [Betaproteobacteria bacterium]|nr:IS110 family transposase [Betaproteobacteria bacterium]